MLWRAIREDLDSLESVSDVLRVLDVVIGFLSSAGGDPEQRVSSYLHDVLKYPHYTHGAGPLQSRTVSNYAIVTTDKLYFLDYTVVFAISFEFVWIYPYIATGGGSVTAKTRP